MSDKSECAECGHMYDEHEGVPVRDDNLCRQ